MESPTTTGKGSANRQWNMPGRVLVPRKKSEEQIVLLLGKSGAGKSRLGNDLLNVGVSDDDYIEFFPEGGGSKGCTDKVMHGTSEDGTLTVIDTPGIPDPTPANTLKYFDAIVEELRRVECINLLVFVAHEGRTNPAQFAEYRLLMTQFNRLRCAKLMVCRQSGYSRRLSSKARSKRIHEGVEFANKLLEQSKLYSTCILHMDGEGDEAQASLKQIYDFTRSFPPENVVDPPMLRTYAELKSNASSLASKEKRLEALKAERKALEAELMTLALQRNLSLVLVPGKAVAYGVATTIRGMAVSIRTEVERTRRMRKVEAEIRAGVLGPDQVRKGQLELQSLEAEHKTSHAQMLWAIVAPVRALYTGAGAAIEDVSIATRMLNEKTQLKKEIEAEIRTGVVDPDALRKAILELEELEALSR